MATVGGAESALKRALRTLQARQPSRAAIRAELGRTGLLVAGTLLAALGYVIFQVPHKLAAGGLTGISIIANHFSGLPVGTLFWILNLPLLALGFRHLGRWPFLARTLAAATLFAVFTDLLNLFLPQIMTQFPVTEDLLLNTVYGGIVGGVGGGLIYRAGSTMGGTGVIGRIIQQRTGLPLSATYFYTDGFILAAMGLVFGWEITLYGLLMLLLNGMASDYTMEGPSSTRVATIVTTRPGEVADALMHALHRGVSFWEVTGSYSGQKRTMLMCTMYRPQVNEVKRIVAQVDPEAFLTIGVGHKAFGEGFYPLKSKQ